MTTTARGSTWLLAELGGRLAALGRAPVRLLFPLGQAQDVPTGFAALADALGRAVRVTYQDLGRDGSADALGAFSDSASAMKPVDLAREFLKAVRADLEALRAGSGRAPVLLLDDLHRFGPLAGELVRDCLGPQGVGTPQAPIPVIAAFVESDRPEYAGAVEALKKYLEFAPRSVRRIEVGAFVDDEERLAYQQFLLGQRVPLALSGRQDDFAHGLLNERLGGVPSRLTAEEAEGLLGQLKQFGLLEVADDTARLRALT
ncbi:MAG: hypothetical protein R3F43_28240 [bacterium]